MSYVWIVVSGQDYDPPDSISVFSTLDKAKIHAESLMAGRNFTPRDYTATDKNPFDWESRSASIYIERVELDQAPKAGE